MHLVYTEGQSRDSQKNRVRESCRGQWKGDRHRCRDAEGPVSQSEKGLEQASSQLERTLQSKDMGT